MKHRRRPAPKTILITGASSGIGAALAQTYAAPGVTLYLSGRNDARLQTIAESCRSRGADVETALLNVADRQGMRRWIDECDARSPLDLVIANAGISGGSKGPDGEAEDQVRAIFDINLTGVLNTVHPAVDVMRRRARGQIALVSSLAGYRGLPSAPAYSASKAAVKAYGEALRGQLRHSGIAVNVICPGFVTSRITDQNDFPMPFMMPANRAATIVRTRLAANRAVIAFPWPMRFALGLLRALPSRLVLPLLSGLPAKGAQPAPSEVTSGD